MSFTSIAFPLFFLIVFFLYNVIPLKFRYLILLAGSILFYGLYGYQYLLAILSLGILTYSISFGAKIKSKWKWSFFTLHVVLVLSALFALKYFNSSLRLFKVSNDIFLNVVLPLGFSFYSLTSISYLYDVYKGKTNQEKNPLKLLLFLCFFLSVLQGPLTRYESLSKSISEPSPFDSSLASEGLKRAALGYFKKLIIADSLALFVNSVYGSLNTLTGFPLFLAMMLYSIVIYMDFSGYSDIAIGLGKVLGFNLPENFDLPYLSHNLQEFWRKWHISLSFWYRDYIYIPLGGSRVPKWRWIINIAIVWILTGLWHDFTIPYLLWGAYNGIILILLGLFKGLLDRTIRSRPFFNKSRFSALRIVFTFLIVSIGWVFFRSPDLSSIGLMLSKAWRIFDFSSFSDGSFASLNINYTPFIVGLVGTAISLLAFVMKRYVKLTPMKESHASLKEISVTFVLALIVAGSFANSIYLSSLGGNNGFIYFNF